MDDFGFDDITEDAINEMEYKGYEMNATDRSNIDQIKKLLENNSYKTRQQLVDHLQYIENLENKLEEAYKIELPVHNNFTLLADVKDVKKIVQKLMELLEKF